MPLEDLVGTSKFDKIKRESPLAGMTGPSGDYSKNKGNPLETLAEDPVASKFNVDGIPEKYSNKIG
jgi:hypothetical protein